MPVGRDLGGGEPRKIFYCSIQVNPRYSDKMQYAIERTVNMDRRSLIVFFMITFWLFTPNLLVYSAVLTAAVIADVSGITTESGPSDIGSSANAVIES